METPAILVVDDEASALRSVRRTLRAHGFENVLTLSDSREVRKTLGEHRVALMLLDLIMPHVSGEEILADLARRDPDLPVIVVTAEQEVGAAVRCMKLGAIDYLLKPVESGQLVATVERALEESAREERPLVLSMLGVDAPSPSLLGVFRDWLPLQSEPPRVWTRISQRIRNLPCSQGNTPPGMSANRTHTIQKTS